MVKSIEFLLMSTDISKDEKFRFFSHLIKIYGRSALLLSGGGASTQSHVGIVRSLLRENLMPRIISGANAGAVACAIVGTNKKADIQRVNFFL